jgi:hypothetical protein
MEWFGIFGGHSGRREAANHDVQLHENLEIPGLRRAAHPGMTSPTKS